MDGLPVIPLRVTQTADIARLKATCVRIPSSLDNPTLIGLPYGYMTPTDLVFWLWSSFELANPATDPRKVGFTPEQAAVIADHLQMVLTKVTPDRAAKLVPPPKEPTYCTNVTARPLEGSLLCSAQIERLDILSATLVC